MSKSKENSKKKQLEKIERGDLNNLVLDGMKQTVKRTMKWDETQEKPLEMSVTFDFDGVVLGRLVDEAAVRQLKVVDAARYKPKFVSVEDFLERAETERTVKVADLLSPKARKEMNPIDEGMKAYEKANAEERKKMLEAMIAYDKANGNV